MGFRARRRAAPRRDDDGDGGGGGARRRARRGARPGRLLARALGAAARARDSATRG